MDVAFINHADYKRIFIFWSCLPVDQPPLHSHTSQRAPAPVCRGLSGILCTNTAYFIVSKSLLSPVANILFLILLWRALNWVVLCLFTPRHREETDKETSQPGPLTLETIKSMVISETFFFWKVYIYSYLFLTSPLYILLSSPPLPT